MQPFPRATYAIAKDGTGTLLGEAAAERDLPPQASYVWTHLHVEQEGTREWLEEEAKLDSSIVTALMAARSSAGDARG